MHENHRHLYPCEEEIIERTHDDFMKDANSAQAKNEVVNGIKGRCFLDELIRIPDDVPVDAMHQVFLGCAKSIITALVTSIPKRNVAPFEKRLKGIKTPRSVHGRHKAVSEIMHWKARDFELFLFLFGSYCLQDFVEEPYHQSFNQFSVAMRLLSMEHVTEANIEEADRLIRQFQRNFVDL